jgi:hypothetical protein
VKPRKNSHLFRIVTTSSTCVYDWTTVGLASAVAVSTAHSIIMQLRVQIVFFSYQVARVIVVSKVEA